MAFGARMTEPCKASCFRKIMLNGTYSTLESSAVLHLDGVGESSAALLLDFAKR